MVEERFKISLEEKKLLERAKLEQTEQYDKQLAADREKFIRQNEALITRLRREIAFKKAY